MPSGAPPAPCSTAGCASNGESRPSFCAPHKRPQQRRNGETAAYTGSPACFTACFTGPRRRGEMAAKGAAPGRAPAAAAGPGPPARRAGVRPAPASCPTRPAPARSSPSSSACKARRVLGSLYRGYPREASGERAVSSTLCIISVYIERLAAAQPGPGSAAPRRRPAGEAAAPNPSSRERGQQDSKHAVGSGGPVHSRWRLGPHLEAPGERPPARHSGARRGRRAAPQLRRVQARRAHALQRLAGRSAAEQRHDFSQSPQARHTCSLAAQITALRTFLPVHSHRIGRE